MGISQEGFLLSHFSLFGISFYLVIVLKIISLLLLLQACGGRGWVWAAVPLPAKRAALPAPARLWCWWQQGPRVRLRHAALQILPVPDVAADSSYETAHIRGALGPFLQGPDRSGRVQKQPEVFTHFNH